MKCSNCGCENEENVLVCSHCSTPLQSPAAEATCPHCGKQIRPSAKYCVYCGEKRGSVPAEEAPPQTEAVWDLAAPLAELDAQPVSDPATAPAAFPAYQLPTHRGLAKMFFLGILTCMLYPIVILSRISEEVNIVASRHDGKRTVQLLWLPLLSTVTLGIYPFVWCHGLCSRIGTELQRRQLRYKFGASSFWLWNFLWGIIGYPLTAILGAALFHLQLVTPSMLAPIVTAAALLSSIGPWVFTHKLMQAMNLMNSDYNQNG